MVYNNFICSWLSKVMDTSYNKLTKFSSEYEYVTLHNLINWACTKWGEERVDRCSDNDRKYSDIILTMTENTVT